MEALKEMTVDMNREAAFLCRAAAVRADRAGTAPLGAALGCGLVTEKFQHAADGDPISDGRVVELSHGLRRSVLPFLVGPDWPLPAAFCSARWAR